MMQQPTVHAEQASPAVCGARPLLRMPIQRAISTSSKYSPARLPVRRFT
jgi:hypothetical protein